MGGDQPHKKRLVALLQGHPVRMAPSQFNARRRLRLNPGETLGAIITVGSRCGIKRQVRARFNVTGQGPSVLASGSLPPTW